MICIRSEMTSCPRCEYDIHLGVPTGQCPECGLLLDEACCVFRPALSSRGPLMTIKWAAIVLYFGLLTTAVTTGFVIGETRHAIIVSIIGLVFAIGPLIRVRALIVKPIIVTSRDGVSFGPRHRMRSYAWGDVQRVSVTERTAWIKVASRFEPITLPSCFDNRGEAHTFEGVANRLRIATDETPSPPVTTLLDESRQHSAKVVEELERKEEDRNAEELKTRGWTTLMYIYAIVGGLIAWLVSDFGQYWGFAVAGVFFFAPFIWLAAKSWNSDFEQNPRQPSASSADMPSGATED